MQAPSCSGSPVRLQTSDDPNHLKVPRHSRDLKHPPEVRLGMHQGNLLSLEGQQEIHQHSEAGGVDEGLLIEGQDDCVAGDRQIYGRQKKGVGPWGRAPIGQNVLGPTGWPGSLRGCEPDHLPTVDPSQR